MKSILAAIERHRAGYGGGVYSLCSAHALAIESAMRLARARGECLLLEATSNQVNQDGGYTGMRPADFREFAAGLARAAGLPPERLVLGGDHLGPNCWQSLAADEALARAARMIADYVEAGFRKIHIDCSMSCADDPRPLPEEHIAERAARLAGTAESAWQRAGGAAPLYVIGTEVPVPGGAHETLGALAVTRPAAAVATIEAHRRAFAAHGLDAAWARVIALVVQPGVEFDNEQVVDYAPARARDLARSIEVQPGMVFEAHSTDYQTAHALRALVRDHFAILKVGPAATFALREALWALDMIACESGVLQGPGLRATVLEAMRAQPKYWSSYYTDAARLALDMQFSLSDRIRYYWGEPAVRAACERLLHAWRGGPLPWALLSQYAPRQFAALRAGELENDARAIVRHAVELTLLPYAQACAPAERVAS